MPRSISVQVLPPSCVRNSCGRCSSRRKRFTATYALAVSNRDASMIEIFAHGPTPGGVTSRQCLPPSAVRHTRPSSVPAQITLRSRGDSPSAYTTPRCARFAYAVSANTPAFGGVGGFGRVRSGLMMRQCAP